MPFSSGEENFLQLNQDDFDFNIQFEQIFFAIIPSTLFIVSSLWRTVSQARKPTVVDAPLFELIKLATITAYAGLELSQLILVAVGSFLVSNVFLAASVLKLVSALFMVSLSFVDHRKSPRPSVLLSSYLFVTLILDAAQARTLFLSSEAKPELTYSSIFSAAIAFKVVILLLEAQRKSRWVSWDEKEHSPEETSSIFSIGVFFWLNGIFFDGYSKILRLKDLYPLDSTLHSQLLHSQFSKYVDYAKLKTDKFGLVKVLVRTLKVPLLLPVPPRLALLGFTFCQPLFIEKLLEHLAKPEVERNVGYGFIGASLLIYAGIAISTALYWYFHHRMRTMTSSILITEIFIKATKARIGVGNDSAALTLMSTDIERINMGFKLLHDVWASVIQVSVAAWLLYTQLGTAFLAPMVIVLLCTLGLGALVKYTGPSQRLWMAGVQKRVGLTATVIASMKNLKISGLSVAVRDFVQQLRVDELHTASTFRKLSILAAVFGFIPLLAGPPITFAFVQRTLDNSRMFTSLSYLLLLTNPLSQVFQAVPQLLSGLACLGRIQEFLACETREDFRQVLSDMKRDSEKETAQVTAVPSSPTDPEIPIAIQNGNFGWEADKFILRNINTAIPKSSLTMVVGPVGSGKSSLCKALLGEIPFSQGVVALSTRFPHVGFCDQTAFLSNGTIRDNIIGVSPFDRYRYNEIIQATALTYDFETLAQGDRTNIGSDGITLSGGQKQRVSLARALYLQSDLLVLDDIFSGLDADTEEQVFRQVFGPDGLLRRRGSTVVLCTHSIRHLPVADYIIALGGGTIVEQGSFAKLMSHQGYIQGLGLNSLSDTCSDASSESSANTREPKMPRLHTFITNASSNESEVDESRRLGDNTVYKHYFKSMGWFVAIFCVAMGACWGFFTNFPTIWLTFWTDDLNSANPSRTFAYYAGIYGLLQFCAILSLFSLGWAIIITSVTKAGVNLHWVALKTLVSAPLRFFTTTDTGVVTNLFSQDMNLIDMELPNGLLNTIFSVFQALGQAAVMLTTSPYMAISYPFLCVLLYVVQRFYLRTSRQLRLLDLEAKSPLYTHFLDTVKGITTLRAFGFVANDVLKNAQLINASQRPAYLLVMIQQWLTLVLDIVVMIMAVILTALAVKLHSSSAFTGASLVTLMGFGENLSGIVIFYTRLETSIGAIARLKTFSDTVKPEDKEEEDIIPPEQWPQRGVMEFNGVSASYDDLEDQPESSRNLALRDITLTIKSGEKIAICGRTGSGKSSLVALILKLLNPIPTTAKNVSIDNTPLHRIDRSALRQRIIAVPQEAVFLPDGSTFQDNLDPLSLATAKDCQEVLVAVDLWSFVQAKGGLGAGMSADSLSAGQRQLMSLGRALLRRRVRARNLGLGGGGSEGGILLLDEVSSSVDHETERVMQKIIRAEFKDYTVVAVSHRLDMIMDFDRVIVMDTGEAVEVGNPMALSAVDGTRFGELVKAGAK